VVDDDRLRTCRATGNDRLPGRLPTVPTGRSARTRTSGGLWGPGRRVLLGGFRRGRWPILARAPGEDGPNYEKDNPREPRPSGLRANPPAPGRLGPWGSSAPRGTPTAFPSLARESLVPRPEGRLNLTAATAGGATHRPAVRRPGPSALLAGTQPGFPGPTASAPRGEAESRRRPGARQGDVSAGHTRMPSS
jgi:hypothetical protein